MNRWNRFKEQNKSYTFNEYMKCHGIKLDSNGKYYEMTNPNAKYDYYTIDGKCYYELPKPFQKPDESYGRYKKSQLCNGSRFVWFYRFIHAIDEWLYIRKSKTVDKETKRSTRNIFKFIKNFEMDVVPYCFIKPDGEWVCPGTIGWFACDDSTEESYKQYLKEWKEFWRHGDDCYVSFCDLHI